MIDIATITIEAFVPSVVAQFWKELLGYEQVEHPTESIRLDDPTGKGPTLLVQPGSHRPPGHQNRIHLDLRPQDRDAAVEHALRLGATPCDVGQTGAESWVVLADPEGNEFCVLQTLEDLERRRRHEAAVDDPE